jgi:folate-binding Fe-S cluster repair protein YgfZ
LSDVLQLEVGQTHSSLICGNKGKIQHHLLILRSHSNEWIVICDPGEGRMVGTLLDNFHVREDLKLRLLNNQEMLRMDLIGS